MSNGYGGSSGSSYSSSTRARRVAATPIPAPTSTQAPVATPQPQVAPPGFHFMPDGTLMSDAEHIMMFGSIADSNIIRSLDLDLSSIPAAGEQRSFSVIGDNESEFILEIKDKDTGKYYNFATNLFQTASARLEKTIVGTSYVGYIVFPAVTGSSDQYDIFLYAKPGTRHADYVEARFADNSLDINSSIGSNSLMMQKVIYQYSALTLTMQGYSPNSTVTGTFSSETFTVDKFKSKNRTAFSLTATANAATSYKILKQPSPQDVLSYLSVTVGSDPENLPGEDVFPAVTGTTTVSPAIAGGGGVVKVVVADAVADIMVVGDKITASTTTDTVDGAVTSGVKVVMDNNVDTKMAIGDRITASNDADANHFLNRTIVTVAELNPDSDNVKEFSMSEAVALSDGLTLTFTPKCNRSETTVVALNPDGDNTSEFSMSQNIGLREGVTLSFSNRKNKRWSLDNVNGLSIGDNVIKESTDVNIESDTFLTSYKEVVTINADTEDERVEVKSSVPAIDTKDQLPTITDGIVTTQLGSVVFNKQQPLALGGDTIKIAGYGLNKIFNSYGYEILLTDLAISLDPITTTTTSTVSNSTTVPVASVNGVLPSTTSVSGIGIDPAVDDPIVNSRSVTSGAGNLELSAAQTLENGVTLTYANSGQLATITGNIEILRAGSSNQTIYFDLEKLLSVT